MGKKSRRKKSKEKAQPQVSTNDLERALTLHRLRELELESSPYSSAQQERHYSGWTDALVRLRVKYELLGKEGWWWVFDDALKEIAESLIKHNFVIIDGFLGSKLAPSMQRELERAYRAGRLPETKHEMIGCPRLEPGALAGGSTGNNLSYKMDAVRGDFVAWVTGKESACEWTALPELMTRLSTLVSELGDSHVPELKGIKERANPMITCYPGGGAHYVKHCDNTPSVANGRRITSLYYANGAWKRGDGGELRVYAPATAETGPEAVTAPICDVAPIGDRVVLFFSDCRVPHEVLPARTLRFAVTLWFFDSAERARAKQNADDSKAEREKIEKEIEKFEKKFGEKAAIAGKNASEQVGRVEGSSILFEPD